MADASNILVTGGAGFIGSHLVEGLLQTGHSVRVLDNLTTGHLSNLSPLLRKIEFIQGDIRDIETVRRAMQGIELVLHQAAVVSVPQTIEDPINSTMVNDLGTLHVLETARQQGVHKVVLASSCAVYGENRTLPKNETMRPEPLSPYALQKLTDEHYARLYTELYDMPTVCLRYFNVYGPRQDPSSPYSGVISIFMTKALNHEPPLIYGNGDQSRDFVYVRDVVRANLLALEAKAASGKVYNIGTGIQTTINTLWRTIAQMVPTDAKPRYGPHRIGDIHASCAACDRARMDLGFEPQFDFSQGIAQTLAWYRRMHATHQAAADR